MPSPVTIVAELLRAELDPSVKVGSWIEDVDYRTYPMVNLRRLGGRNSPDERMIKFPVIEISVYVDDMVESAEQLVDDCIDVIDRAVANQTLTSIGYIHSLFVTFNPGQFDSPFEDTWRMQALVQLGVRPLAP